MSIYFLYCSRGIIFVFFCCQSLCFTYHLAQPAAAHHHPSRFLVLVVVAEAHDVLPLHHLLLVPPCCQTSRRFRSALPAALPPLRPVLLLLFLPLEDSWWPGPEPHACLCRLVRSPDALERNRSRAALHTYRRQALRDARQR